MAHDLTSFKNYMENAFTDAARSGWAEDYDTYQDLFLGRTFIVGPTNSDYVDIETALDATVADEHILFLMHTGTYTPPLGRTLTDRHIVISSLSGIHTDVVFSGVWGNMTLHRSTFILDKVSTTDNNTNGPFAVFNSNASNLYTRVLLNSCYVEGLWLTNTAAKLTVASISYGSSASTGVELSRYTFLSCTAFHARSNTGVNAVALTNGNLKYEFRRTVYNRSTIKDLESAYVPAFDIEDLSLVETGTHGADVGLSVIPMPPNTLGYANDEGLSFSAPLAQADLASIFTENMTLDETHFYEWFREFMDTIQITDGLGVLEVFYERINTSDGSSGTKIISQTVAESLALTVLLKATQSYALRETLSLEHTDITELTTAKIIEESASIGDQLFVEFVEQVLENLNLSETDSNIPQRIMAIYEAMGISDTPHYSSIFARSITETISLLDELGQAKGGTISETINLSIITLKIVLASIVTDICEVTSSLTQDLMVTAISSENIDLSDEFSIQSILNGDISDNIVFSVGIPIDDEQYATYVINTETNAVSEYTNYNFNSISGEYGATETGIYRLEGDTDDGTAIIGSIKTGLIDFGNSYHKQLPYAYIGCDVNGQLMLKVTSTHEGTKKERWYKINQLRDVVDTVRIKLGRGIKSKYYQFELTSVDGADFKIDSIELLPITLKRRL